MATWQAAEPGTVVGDENGNYQIRQGGQWMPMPKGSLVSDDHGAYHFDADAIKPPTASKASITPKAQSTESDISEATIGPSEILGQALLNLPHAAAHSLVDIYRRVTGGDTAAPDPKIVSAIHVPLGTAGQNLENDIGAGLSPAPGAPPTVEDQTQAIRQQALGPQSETVGNVLGHAGAVAGDVGNLAAAGGAVKAIAGIPGEIAANAAARTAAASKYGLRTGESNPIARNVAGESARPAVTEHNQTIADQTLGAQVGVAPGTALTPKALETAREAPNSVYSRAENAIPTGPLSPNAAQAVRSVGADDMVVHSPDTQATIDAQKARLLSSELTGSQVVNAQRALRFNGFKNTASQDPEMSALGQAQLKMSDALHQHMLDTIPAGADVSADQLNAARVALAQNHTVENALKGGNVDLQALARLHRNSPNLLSGPLKDFAEFADLHPEVSSLPSVGERFNPSGIAKDVASVDLKSPATYLQPFFGAAARRVLTGGAEAPTVPVTGLGGEFAPIARTATAAEGVAGQNSLADLLTQEGEHNPPSKAPRTAHAKGRSKPLDESF